MTRHDTGEIIRVSQWMVLMNLDSNEAERCLHGLWETRGVKPEAVERLSVIGLGKARRAQEKCECQRNWWNVSGYWNECQSSEFSNSKVCVP